MKTAKVIIFTATITATVMMIAAGKDYSGDTYSVYAQDGTRLCICDNRTPDDPEDDFVIDYETNRDITITIDD